MKASHEINQNVFFALLRAGLWEQGVCLSPYGGGIDLDVIYKLANEQTVVGLLAAGIEQVEDKILDKKDVLPYMINVLNLEQRNEAMNLFIREIMIKMRAANIFALLVKGQGVAQCYLRPQWRSAGDVDFFLDESNYQKAKSFLTPFASYVDPEDTRRLHLSMRIDDWVVELHGTMHTEISFRINKGIDVVQSEMFTNRQYRVWNNAGVSIYLPDPTNDALVIFTHFIQHFYVGGVGLRQVCDWCRLLWSFRDDIDTAVIRKRLDEMGLLPEWMCFSAFAVEYLGMPADSIPLYSSWAIYRRKARMIRNLILRTGNFGNNINESYRSKYSKLVVKNITLFRRFREFLKISIIFPIHSLRFFVTYVFRRTRATFFNEIG